MHINFVSLFYANSRLHVSALLGHPQGDSQVVRLQPAKNTHTYTHTQVTSMDN
jgi:hypothetical protein